MEVLNIILAVLLVVMAIALIVFVLFQTGGRSNKLSQAISGGSPDNYSGKNKQRSKDKKLSRITTYVSIAFAVLVIVFALIMNYQHNHPKSAAETTTEAAVTTVDETGAETAAETTAEATEAETAAETTAEATEAATTAAE